MSARRAGLRARDIRPAGCLRADQDFQLRANGVERWLGLARIEIQTASGSAGAQMTLEGLLTFVEVPDFIYSRMREAVAARTILALDRRT